MHFAVCMSGLTIKKKKDLTRVNVLKYLVMLVSVSHTEFIKTTTNAINISV